MSSLFQICQICDTQSNIEWRDFCPCCGYEWTSDDINTSTPIPITRPTPRAADLPKASRDCANIVTRVY